jgi:hypothetical protein
LRLDHSTRIILVVLKGEIDLEEAIDLGKVAASTGLVAAGTNLDSANSADSGLATAGIEEAATAGTDLATAADISLVTAAGTALAAITAGFNADSAVDSSSIPKQEHVPSTIASWVPRMNLPSCQ